MRDTSSNYYSVKEVSKLLQQFVLFLFSRPWNLVFAALLGLLLATGYYFIQRPKYEAASTFILEEKSSMGGLAGLASQFGFNIGGLSGGNLFAGDNILNILTSRTVVEDVLLTKVDEQGKDSVKLADLYLEFSGKQKKWSKKLRLKGISFYDAAREISPLQDSVLHVIYDELVKKNISADRLSKQGSIIKLSIKSENSLFARLMVERIVATASKLYFDIKTGVAETNIARMQKTADSLLALLNRRTYSAAAIQQIDLNPALRTAVVPTEIAAREKTVLATLYAEVTKNLEATKLMLTQQTPVIQLLDRPGKLLDDHKKSWLLLNALFVFVCIAVYCAFSFLSFVKVKNN